MTAPDPDPTVAVGDRPDPGRPWWRRRWTWTVTTADRTWTGRAYTRAGADAAAWCAYGEAIAANYRNRQENP